MDKMYEGMFKMTFRIGYRGLDANLRAGVPITMELIQEAGTGHTDSTPFPMQWYADNKAGFIITNISLKISRPPKLGEVLTVYTAPCSFKGFTATRRHIVVDEAGEAIADNYSSWVYMDLINRRPARIPPDIAEGYKPFCDFPEDRDFAIPEPDGKSLIKEDAFAVQRRDADSNMHVNNIAYVAWALEYVPRDVYAGMTVYSLKCAYKKECRPGDRVLAKTYNIDENAYLTRFFDEESNISAEILSRWN